MRWESLGQATALAFNLGSALATIIANKHVLTLLPYPAALTALHYVCSCVATTSLLVLGVFTRGTVMPEHRRSFWTLVVAWAVCNALSNASLGANSVGFYQLMKVLTTPAVVVVDRLWHGKGITLGRATILGLACCGIAGATVYDVQLNLRGSLLALASVATGLVQKTFNEHMQQRGGLSSLQLMHAAFPWMAIIGLGLVPLLDPPGVFSVAPTPMLLLLLGCSCVAAVCINFSTTLVLGVTSALALVLLGQLKTCGTLLAGILVFDAPPNAKVAAGSATAIGCIAWYTFLKMGDGRRSESVETSAQPLLEPRKGSDSI